MLKAINFSENSRYGYLTSFISRSQKRRGGKISKDLLKKEKYLLSRRNYYQTYLTISDTKRNLDENESSVLEAALFNINQSLDSLNREIEQQYSTDMEHIEGYYSEFVKNIQCGLDENKLILEYHISDSAGYVFGIAHDSLFFHEIKSTHSLTSDIKRFRDMLQVKENRKFGTLSNKLYRQLLEPILDQLPQKELVIVPDGRLWYLNFDLLLTQKANLYDPKQFPYLLKSHSISYANSINLLLSQQKEASNDLFKETLAFSYSDSSNLDNTSELSFAALRAAGEDLPGSRKEISNIAEIVDGQYYFGRQSSERNFKENADKYSILHLALHGEIDDEDPQNSKLYFTPAKDSVEDNYLYGFELYNLNIPADLAILSACNTGDGKIAKGEGILSLGSAFQYAGTKSLVLSSWEVSDDVAPQIMKYFYINLKEGLSKAEALRQAKLKFLEEAPQALSDPFYWGNFYLVGDNSPIEFDEDKTSRLILMITLGLVILSVLLISKYFYSTRIVP